METDSSMIMRLAKLMTSGALLTYKLSRYRTNSWERCASLACRQRSPKTEVVRKAAREAAEVKMKKRCLNAMAAAEVVAAVEVAATTRKTRDPNPSSNSLE